MGLFNDTVTIYHKVADNEWSRVIVHGVQWADKAEKTNKDGILSIVRYASVTFPEGTYEDLVLDSSNEEDCIVFGSVEDVVTNERGQRINDLLKKYSKSGTIQSVNDNSNREFLKNIKVVVA